MKTTTFFMIALIAAGFLCIVACGQRSDEDVQFQMRVAKRTDKNMPAKSNFDKHSGGWVPR